MKSSGTTNVEVTIHVSTAACSTHAAPPNPKI